MASATANPAGPGQGDSSASSTSTTTYSSTSTNYNVGPLTTTWTRPSDCSRAWLACSDCGYADQAQTCLDAGSAWQDNPTCFPSITLTPSTTSSDYYMTYLTYGFYSPGIVCPAGYTTACAMQGGTDGVASTVSGSQRFNFDYTPVAGETAVGCCPVGYACANGGYQSCSRQVASTTAEFWQCSSGLWGSITSTQMTLPATETITYTDDYDSSTSTETDTATISQVTIWAPLYQLNYQATDLPASTSSSSSSSFSSTSPSSSSFSTLNTSTSSASSSSNTKTIAVAVTVPVVVVALAVAGFAWFWRRRRAAKRQVSYEPAQPQSPGPVEMSEQTIPYEMAGIDARAELPSGAKPPVSEDVIVHEMDGSGHN